MVLVVFALSLILDGLYLAYVAQILQKCHLCVLDLIFGGSDTGPEAMTRVTQFLTQLCMQYFTHQILLTFHSLSLQLQPERICHRFGICTRNGTSGVRLEFRVPSSRMM